MASHFRRRTFMDCVLVPAIKLDVPSSPPPPPSSAPLIPYPSSPSSEPSPSLPNSPPLSPLFTPPSSPSTPQYFFSSLAGLGDSPSESPHSASHSWQKQQLSDEEGGNSNHSDYQEYLDDADGGNCENSDLERDSENGGDCSLSASRPASLRSKRRRKESHQAPPRKKICMRAPRGSNGYPAEMRTTPTVLPGAPVGSVPYCKETSHVDPSKGCPSTPVTQCAILYKLQMYFGPHGFVCEKCGHMYPPGYLHHHITNKHPDDLDITGTGKQKKQLYKVIVAHLLTSHGVREDVISFDLPETLSDPIPGLTPILSYQCPACPKPRWFAWKSLRCHYREQHQDIECPLKHSIQPRFIIRPYRLGSFEGGRHKLSDTVVLLPEDWTPTNSNSRPDQTVIPRDRPLVPASAPHLVAIGWSEYLQSLKGADVSLLMKLVEMPKGKEMGSFPSKRIALEKGMLQIDTLLVRYLKDANAFLDNCHPSVRKSITSG